MNPVRMLSGVLTAAVLAIAGGVSADDRKPLYWYDPMRPDQHFDAPGKSPFMDMDLVPKYAADGDVGAGSGTVNIDPRMVQNLGIRSAVAELGTFSRRVDAVGGVEADERRTFALESRAAGWVERLDVRAVGDPVRRGQIVAGVFSPELYAAQEELVLAANSGDERMVSASRQRLALLGLSEYQIETVAKLRKAQRLALVAAEWDGVVTELNVREGSRNVPGIPLMRIADLTRVWISAEIPEPQGAWIVKGDEAEVRLVARAGEVYKGRVDYVYPDLDRQSRTVRARIVLENPNFLFKPGMYADVTLFGAPRTDSVLVPTEAVIHTGERSVVILAEGAGRFRPAIVRAGDDRDGKTEILAGLVEGERIVVSGQFLLDSEANLRGVLARMLGDPR